MNRGYVLRQDHIKVLLLGRGYNALMAIGYDDSQPDDAAVLQTLNELTRQKLLSVRDNTFVLLPDLREMIDTMGAARRCLTVIPRGKHLPDKCLYPGERLLCCTIRPSDYEHICMDFVGIEELIGQLYDEGYFPDRDEELTLSSERAEEYEREIFGNLNGRRPDDTSPVLMEVRVLGRDGEKGSVLTVLDYYFGRYIRLCLRGQISRSPFNRFMMIKKMTELIQNDFS